MPGKGCRVANTDPDGLNLQQRAFVDQMLLHGNQTQAYLNAGYKCGSVKSAESNASRLIATDKVSLALARARAKRADRLGISQERVLNEYAALAFTRMRKFSTWGDGDLSLTPSEDLDDADDAAIKKVVKKESLVKVLKKDEESTELLLSREISMELHDKKSSLVELAKHLGMDPKELEAAANGGGKDGAVPAKAWSQEDWDSQ